MEKKYFVALYIFSTPIEILDNAKATVLDEDNNILTVSLEALSVSYSGFTNHYIGYYTSILPRSERSRLHIIEGPYATNKRVRYPDDRIIEAYRVLYLN